MDGQVLGPLESRVMERLWQAGPQTVAQVVTALNQGQERRLAYTTVLTILVRLHTKEYVLRTSRGRQHVYRAAMSQQELVARIGRRELDRLIRRFGAESLASFAGDLTSADSELVVRLRKLAATDER